MEEQLVDVIEETSANELNVGENEHGVDGVENINEHEVDGDRGAIGKDEMIPRLGMVFCSYDEAFNFYKEYARHSGFGVMKRSRRCNTDGELDSVVFACSKEGKPKSANRGKQKSVNKESFRRFRTTSKTNCKARMLVRYRGDGVWVLDYLILDHNHPINPSMSQFQRCFRNSGVHVKRQREHKDKAGLLSDKSLDVPVVQKGGHENLSYNQNDSRNHTDQVRQLTLSGDAEAVFQYFTDMQNHNPNFFHRMDIDGNGRFRNVFWADARSRTIYNYFGDIISFNTTYLMNKYDLFFAQFVGVNHHGHSVLLGCGLLVDETIEAFIWLFEAWLACMSGRPPIGIITDQCEAIEAAVAKVFPHARHRLCEGHMMKKLLEKSGLAENKAIRGRLVKAIHESLTIDEFERDWRQIIENYSLQNIQWLRSLYEYRYRWIPVFVKDTFWAGISKTRHDFCMGACFDGYLASNISLKQFLQQYESALRMKYEKEAQEDFLSFCTSPKLISELKMEEQLSKIYTMNIFRKFQEEVKELIKVNASLLGIDGPFSSYEVKELGRDVHVKYGVIYNSIELEVRCMCRSFEFRGILCRHALCVLMCEGVEEIPEKYILNRWRKDLKHVHALTSLNTELYDNLYTRGLQLFADIVELGAVSNERSQFALKLLSETKEKLPRLNCIFGDMQSISDTFKVGKELSPLLVDCNGRPPIGVKATRVEKSTNNLMEKELVYQKSLKVVNQVGATSIGPRTLQFGPRVGTQESLNPTQQGTHLDGRVSNIIHFQELF